MIENTYPLGFRLALHHKDLAIALEAAAAQQLELPITPQVAAMESSPADAGHGDEDVSALARWFRLEIERRMVGHHPHLLGGTHDPLGVHQQHGPGLGAGLYGACTLLNRPPPPRASSCRSGVCNDQLTALTG